MKKKPEKSSGILGTEEIASVHESNEDHGETFDSDSLPLRVTAYKRIHMSLRQDGASTSQAGPDKSNYHAVHSGKSHLDICIFFGLSGVVN